MYKLQKHKNYFFYYLCVFYSSVWTCFVGSFSVDFPVVTKRGISCLTLARLTASDSCDSCGTIPSQPGRNHTVYGKYYWNLESLNPSRNFILGTSQMVRLLHAWCLGGICFSVCTPCWTVLVICACRCLSREACGIESQLIKKKKKKKKYVLSVRVLQRILFVST